MKKLTLILCLLAPTIKADVLKPPLTEQEWIPIWVGQQLGPFVDFYFGNTFYYEGHFSSPILLAPPSPPLGEFSYVDGVLSWNVTAADAMALWVYEVLPDNQSAIFKIRAPHRMQGSVEIGESTNLAIYGKLRPLPDAGESITLLGIGLLALVGFTRAWGIFSVAR